MDMGQNQLTVQEVQLKIEMIKNVKTLLPAICFCFISTPPDKPILLIN